MPAATTVLLVEDEVLVREMIAEELLDAGFSVREAKDGEIASAILHGDERIDVLFTDIRLPGKLDGWDIAQLARRKHPSLPVIYATGYTFDRTAEVPGAVFLNKPYQPSQIIDAIKALVARDNRGLAGS